MSPHTKRRTLAALCAAGLWLTGCTADEGASQPSPNITTPDATDTPPTPAPETQNHDEPSATDPETNQQDDTATSTKPVGEFSTELQQSSDWPDFGDTSDVYPTAIRGAVHDGFERVVIEHAGTGQPSFHAQYTDEPLEPGRGQPIDTGDQAYLEVTLSGTSDAYDSPSDMLENGAEATGLDTQATGTVVSFLPWERTSTYYLGLDKKRPYSITVLDDPVRVVVDIQLTDQ